MQKTNPSPCYGLLLAAGFSRRFGADKRLQILPSRSNSKATPVGLACLENWLRACGPSHGLDHLYVVTRPDDDFAKLLTSYLQDPQRLSQAPCSLLSAQSAHLGMGHSLASAVSQMPPGALVIGLADMPYVTSTTICALSKQLRDTSDDAIVQACYRGSPGNPLGFGCAQRDTLMRCQGDQGARSLVRAARDEQSLLTIEVADAGILYDIDKPADLADENSERSTW